MHCIVCTAFIQSGVVVVVSGLDIVCYVVGGWTSFFVEKKNCLTLYFCIYENICSIIASICTVVLWCIMKYLKKQEKHTRHAHAHMHAF